MIAVITTMNDDLDYFSDDFHGDNDTEGFDVMNALEVLDSTNALLENEKFLRGDADLNWYLYNWKVTKILPLRSNMNVQ